MFDSLLVAMIEFFNKLSDYLYNRGWERSAVAVEYTSVLFILLVGLIACVLEPVGKIFKSGGPVAYRGG